MIEELTTIGDQRSDVALIATFAMLKIEPPYLKSYAKLGVGGSFTAMAIKAIVAKISEETS